ncbi:MAG: flagellar hook-associated protein 2 [Crocinitomicaceae bacterium]|jgi:flagellar hook-associated protein 2
MAAIESLGIGSDLLTSDLVESIINADKAAGERRLGTRQNVIDAKISAYGEIQSKLFEFSEAIVVLADDSNAGATKSESSDETILTAAATTSAPSGTYAVEVQRIAKANSLVSEPFTSVTEAVGEGELTFSFGTTNYNGSGGYDSFTTNPDAATQKITINDGNDSLQGLRNAINDAAFGVKASIVFNGSGYVLQMTSEETGEDMSMKIVAKDENGALATTGLSSFAYNKNQAAAGTNLTQTQAGQDALINVNGLSVTRSSNEVTELIDGVTLNLKSANVGEEVSITVGADISAISANIQKMIDTYNNFQDTYKDLTAFDETKSTGSLLLGDSTLRSINNQVKSIMTSTVSGISGTSFRSFSELGIFTDQNDRFKLSFDSSLFLKGLNEDRESVSGVFSTQGTTTDNRIRYLNESINTKPGSYDINITQLATKGSYQGGNVELLNFLSPVEVNNSNDSLGINLNGKDSLINLTQGSYSSGDELAAEIQLQINSAKDFTDRGSSSTVAFDAANNSFSMTSNTYGSSSQIYVTSADTNTANTLGFAKLGEGEFKGTPLSTLNSEYFNGYGTSTFPSSKSVNETSGINFASSNATFDISLNGGAAETVTVNLNAGGSDLNSDGIFGDRKDVLQAIQTAVDATALNGNVTASFNDANQLIFKTTNPSATDTIEITAVGSNTSDVLLGLSTTDGVQITGKDPGLTFGTNVNFQLGLNGTDSANTISLPPGTYNTGADLATALEAQINSDLASDANLSPLISGALTTEGTRDIAANIDFSAANAGFVLNVNGVEKTILMDADSGNNITDIQTKLDAEFGAGIVTAQLGSGNGLELITNSQTTEDFIQIVSDGRGAFTSGGAVIAGGIDFSGANNATFDLLVDGVTLNVDVNGNAASGDKNDSLSAIQEALDLSILNNSAFQAGDIVAKLDSSDQIYFETVSRDGVKTSGMFGSSATIEIQAADANAQATLGLPGVNTSYTGGYDAFGMDDEIKFGSDITADVRYEYNPDTDKGQLIINVGGYGNTVSFSNVDAPAVSFLGIKEPDGSESEVFTGLDTEGTINGITANGNGQFLTAQNGNAAATNGFFVANQTAVEAAPLTIDATNEEFTIKLDGIEAVITIPQKTYASGTELATAMQKAINENAVLDAKDLSVKVDYTDDIASSSYGTIGIISKSTGSGSKVEITDISSEAASAYGFTVGQGNGETGKRKDGEIDNASGIRIKVEGGDLGDRGSITYVSGIADQLKNLLKNFLDPNGGTLNTKFTSLEVQQTTLDEDKESFDARIEATEARLKSQFLYNDLIISSLKTTEDFLTQQFEAMASSRSK